VKTLAEIRLNFDLYPQEICSRISYFKNLRIDWDVFLPTKKMNLQRGYCWSLSQKRDLIWSVLIRRHIPHCAVINSIDKNNDREDVWLIIDGKQRLSTIFDFVDNKFSIEIDGNEYLFSELPMDYQKAILNYSFRYYVVNEPWETRITDEQKIAWFRFINFAGTAQDNEHLKKIES